MQYLKRAEVTQNLTDGASVSEVVRGILEDIQTRGDTAVRQYEEQFSRVVRTSFCVTEDELERAEAELSEDVKALIDRTIERVTAFAKAQLQCLKPLEAEFGEGITLGHRLVPIESVGAYVPGGRFPLLSSAAMVIVPAKVAGVERIVACCPATQNNQIHPAVLYSLRRSGATEIYAIGGAQAIGALAYGTESIKPVDMISGPGNRYVAEAKRQVFGRVGIDLFAGPSEVLVFADESASPSIVAKDLLAQAEHDPMARAILVSTSALLANQVLEEVQKIIDAQPSEWPARTSWANMGEVVIVKDIDEGVQVCNDYAIEHLHVQIAEPRKIMERLCNYGSLFLGESSSVVFSDKVSGTNHTLPTREAARYTGGLWVGSYIKVLTYQEVTGTGIHLLATHSEKQSAIEGLEGHRLSAAARL